VTSTDDARRLLARPELGPIKGKRLAPVAGAGLLWVEIHADGGESPRRGPVWSTAPALSGMRSWFAHDLVDGRVVRVVLASRRHQVGRRIRGVWRARGGRFVDVGTLYTEADPKSLSGRPTAPLRRAYIAPLPPHVMKVLSGEAAPEGDMGPVSIPGVT
jgi:hypothetical protein